MCAGICLGLSYNTLGDFDRIRQIDFSLSMEAV